MIYITPKFSIDEKDIQLEFIRASGPGGQNVNKVATAVQLRFNVKQANLPNDIQHRLSKLAGRRLTEEGDLVIKAQQFRQQERNREEAINRLVSLLKQAAQKPKFRRKTNPTLSSKQRRLKNKRRRADIKRRRQSIKDFQD